MMVGDGYGSAREVAGFMKMVGSSGSGRLASLACLVYYQNCQRCHQKKEKRKLTFKPIHRIVPTSD